MDWFLPTLTWYLATTAVALSIAPGIAVLFEHVTDKGASLVRPLSLLIGIWPAWFFAGLGDGWLPFNNVMIWGTVVLLALACWPIAYRAGTLAGSTLRHYAISEGAYLLLFAGLVALRGFIPGVGGPSTSDQEKPMDLMMLASSMQATSMPPADAWLAGESVNYYYAGYALWAGIGNMVGTTPAIAYNLAVVSIIAMSIVALAGTIANILSQFTRSRMARIGGILAVGLVILIGTPWAAWQVATDPGGQWQAWPFDGIMWEATRIIPVSETVFAISEFPAFTFLFADLHPHMMAIPFVISALGLAWMLATLPPHMPLALRGAQLGVAGLLGVGLYAINSWDFPTWFAVIVAGIVVSSGFRTALSRLAAIGTALLIGVLAWAPFILRFDAPVRHPDTAFADAAASIPVVGDVVASIAAYSGDRTSISDWLSIFGFFYPIIVVAILVALLAPRSRDVEPDSMVNMLALISGIIVVAIGLLLPVPLLILLGLPLLGAMVVLIRSTTLTLELLVVGFGALSLLLALIPEFFFLHDAFGTRMNTIFKLYLQSWLLGGVAASLGIIWLWQRARRWAPGQIVLSMAITLILVAGLTYPVVAASQWTQFKNPDQNWEGMDGLAWLEESDPASYASLEWLWENGTADDVLLAAGGCAYRAPIGFPAAASGVPTIIGWDNHQRQWRLGSETINAEIQDRVADVVDLFARPTDELLDAYGVTLLYIGRAETDGVSGVEPTDTCAPGPFPETRSSQFPGPGWTEVFSEVGFRILRRDAAE